MRGFVCKHQLIIWIATLQREWGKLTNLFGKRVKGFIRIRGLTSENTFPKRYLINSWLQGTRFITNRSLDPRSYSIVLHIRLGLHTTAVMNN